MPKNFMMAAALLAAASAGHAQDIDPHALYESACAGCHRAHSGDFVFESMTMTGAGLEGKTTGKLVADLLGAGHGRLSSAETDTLIAHFEAINSGGQLFQDKCFICHERAVVLSRLKLVEEDGRLVGRYTGRDIEAFLHEHGRLTLDEIPIILERLQSQMQ